MGIPERQFEIRSQKDSFSDWGAVFMAIVITAAIVGALGYWYVSERLEKGRIERAEAHNERMEKRPSIFEKVINEPSETPESTEETEE